MTRRDIITCFHEPFGDAFYFGPEKISRAWLRWPAQKLENSGRTQYSYDYVLSTILDTAEVKSLPILVVMYSHIVIHCRIEQSAYF